MGLMEEQLVSAVRSALNARIEEETAAMIKEATNRLHKELATIVAGISIQLLEHVSVERLGTMLRIEVDFPKEDKS